MLSVITNIYNKKTKGPTLMEFCVDKKNQLDVTFSYPHWITMHGQPHIRLNGIVHSHRKTEFFFFDN